MSSVFLKNWFYLYSLIPHGEPVNIERKIETI